MESLPDIHRYPLEVPQSCPLMVSQPRKGKNKLECPFKRATGLQKNTSSALESYFKSNNKSKLSSQHCPQRELLFLWHFDSSSRFSFIFP